MGRAQVYSILFYLHLVVESRNTLPAQIYIYKFIYIYIYAHKYTYICANIYISIHLWGREGAVMRRLGTKASRRRWYDQSSWAVLGHGEKLIVLSHRPNIGGTRASWFPGGLGSGQQLQAVLMLGPGLGFQCRSGCWTFLGMGLPRQRTPPAFFISHRDERVYVFLSFFCGSDGIRNLILLLFHPLLLMSLVSVLHFT